jgi:adenylylsulfate kinase
MTKNNNHIIPHQHLISKKERQGNNRHKSMVVWFTGLSGSGKSTLAGKTEQVLHALGYHTYILDGDNVRTGLNAGLGFTETDRQENIRRIGEVAKLFVDAGIIVLTAFISPNASDRMMVRKMVGTDEFTEVFVNCPLEICEQRDVKGLYQKARKGEILNFTGIDAPFEVPLHPELEVLTHMDSLETCVDKVVQYLIPKLAVPEI